MSTSTKNYRFRVSRELFPILLFAVISLFALTWFKGEDYILAGDLGWPLSFERFFDLTRSIWDTSVAPGYNAPRQLASFFPYATYGYAAESLGISSSVFQRIVYIVSFFFSGFGLYLFARELNLKKLPSIITGLFYMLSPYALIVVWNPSYGTTFPFYAFLPLGLWVFYRYLKEKNGLFSRRFASSLIVIFLSFIGASYSNPAYLLLFLGSILLVSLYNSLNEKKEYKIMTFKKMVLFGVLYAVLNSFWILPSIVKTDFGSADNTQFGIVDDRATQYINSVYFKDSLRMSGHWTMFSGHNGGFYYTFNQLWDTDIYTLFSYTGLLFSILYVLKKKDKKSAGILALFVSGVALNSGLRAPRFFENFIQPFFELPVLSRVFRSIYLKLGFLLVLPVSLLVGSFFNTLNYKKKSPKIVLVLFLVVFAYVSYPFFTGEIIRGKSEGLPSFGTSIPSEYKEIADVINEDSVLSRTLVFPIPLGYNYHLQWEDGGYVGADFLRSYVKSSLYYVGNRSFVREFGETNDIDLLRRLSVDYIIVRKDIYQNNPKFFLTNDIAGFEEKVLGHVAVSKVAETTYLDLYKIAEDFTRPPFFIEDESGYTVPSVKKYSDTRYVLSSGSSTGTLVFTEEFDSSWIAEDSMGVPLGGHEKYDTYANSWEITSQTPEIEIYYDAQKYFDWAILAVGITFGGLVFMYVRERLGSED